METEFTPINLINSLPREGCGCLCAKAGRGLADYLTPTSSFPEEGIARLSAQIYFN